MRKHKFKGRELTECLKRIGLKKVSVGEKLAEDGQDLEGFYIILAGKCSRHFTEDEMIAKRVEKQRLIKRSSTNKMLLEDEMPRFMNLKMKKLDSMDFSPGAMLHNIMQE